MTSSGPSDATPARRFVRTLREDVSSGLEHIVFSRLVGSALMPRTARRLLLVAAGAAVESGPGGVSPWWAARRTSRSATART